MKLIAGNWKMNPISLSEAKILLNKVKSDTKRTKNVEILICPPFIYLTNLQQATDNRRQTTGNPVGKPRVSYGAGLKLGGQNCFWKEKGAFTGEISALMLKNLGCEYVILGHSERRSYLKETNEMLAEKLAAAINARLKPILCIGETGEERKQEKTIEILKTQLESVLNQVISRQLSVANLSIAYEPIWAIGTGNNCSTNEAMTILMFIKKELLKILPEKLVKRIRILYGGSANSSNVKSYIETGFDGFLVGGASLKAEEFVKMVKICDTAP